MANNSATISHFATGSNHPVHKRLPSLSDQWVAWFVGNRVWMVAALALMAIGKLPPRSRGVTRAIVSPPRSRRIA